MSKESKEFIENCKYALIAVDNETGNVLHFVGYHNPPSVSDVCYLYDELKTNPDLKLTERGGWSLHECPEDMFEDLLKQAKQNSDAITIHGKVN